MKLHGTWVPGILCGRAWATAGALMLLTGCVTTGTGLSVARTAIPVPLPPCPEGAGTTQNNPIRGRELSRLLGKELLVCPGGSIARVASHQTTITTSGGSATSADVISISCPDSTLTYYTDSDGEPELRQACIPAPLTMLAADAAACVEESTMRLRAADFAGALRLASRAEKIAPESEAVLVALGTAQMAMGKFEDAERSLGKALNINQGTVAVRLAHAVCLSEIGDKAGYAAEIFRLYDEIPKSDQLHWELTCRMADNFNRIGNRQEAIRLARVACEHGVTMCCDLGRSDIDAREVE